LTMGCFFLVFRLIFFWKFLGGIVSGVVWVGGPASGTLWGLRAPGGVDAPGAGGCCRCPGAGRPHMVPEAGPASDASGASIPGKVGLSLLLVISFTHRRWVNHQSVLVDRLS